MKNTLSKKEYIKKQLFWGTVLFVWCCKFLFRGIGNYTYTTSVVIYLFVVGNLLGLGILYTLKTGRNNKNVFQNITLSFGPVILSSYLNVFKEKIIMTGIVVGILSTIVTIVILFRKICREDKKEAIIKMRIRNVLNLWRRNVSLGILILLIPVCVSVLFNGTILNSEVKVSKVYGDEHSLASNIEDISKIEPKRWEQLDVQEKLDVCQKIVNCEGRYLGISHELFVGTASLKERELGHYSNVDFQIVIDLEHLSSSHSYEILETLIHEVTHAYQFEQVKLYQKLDAKERNLLMFSDVAEYLEEFTNYEDGKDDFLKYYGQQTEINARKAAEEGVIEYKEKIEKYLLQKEKVKTFG